MKVYYFASFGNFDKLPLGGGQTAARRLARTLENCDVEVNTYNRSRHYSDNKIIDKIYLVCGCLIDPVLYFFFLLFKSRKNSATLYFGYSGSMLAFDFLMVLISNLLGFTTIFYLGGGGTSLKYDNAGILYKKIFGWCFSLCDDVMVEGYENKRLIERVCDSRVFYLPNFTEDGFAPEQFPERSTDQYNFLYFGRINPTKSIFLIIDTFERIHQKYPNSELTIVGGGSNDYVNKVVERINNSSAKDRIHKVGRVDHVELCDIIKKHHFFVFPSNEPREGHSNALNEAMSWGLVPIVSDNNFLPDIVGDKSLVCSTFNAEDYYEKVSSIIEQDVFDVLSRKMYNRVRDNFVQGIVEKRLKDELSKVVLQ